MPLDKQLSKQIEDAMNEAAERGIDTYDIAVNLVAHAACAIAETYGDAMGRIFLQGLGQATPEERERMQ